MALIARSPENEGESKPTGTPSRREGPSREDVARWLSALIAPEGCVELRALGVGRKGHGDHAESKFFTAEEFEAMARAALALSGRAKGIYWTLNPVHSGLYLDINHASAKASDILSRRWLFIDCDPIKPEADASTTDLEKSASALVAREVRKHLRSLGWPDPVLADSGNGHHLLYRCDLPNDDDAHELVKKILQHLAAKFSTNEVAIDTSVHDASRICKVYGTLARKGEPSADRPHRFSRVIDLPEPVEIVPADSLRALVKESDGTPAVVAPKGLIARAKVAMDPQRAYALAALKAETDKVATCGSGGRNVQLNTSAFALGQLVAAGQLGEGEVVASLVVAALACGLEVTEATKAIGNGLGAGKALPRDLADVGKGLANGNGHGNGHGVPRMIPAPGGGGGAMEADDDPHRLAGVYIDSDCTHEDGLTLRFWMERWHRWDGAAWRIVPDAEISAEVTRSIKGEFDRIAIERSKASQAVGTKCVGNVLQALRSRTLLTARECPRQPAWIGGVGPEPIECISAKNGVIHLPTIIASEVPPLPIPPTPRFFSPNALEYPFRCEAPEPTEWLKFLGTLWPDDEESIECLQEWFGYLITPDTCQQKMMFIIGPRRSGKGTIFRVLRSLVGPSNVAAPTLSGLATHFGASSLIGKSVAIVPDARLSARADSQIVVERLLSITGEDPQTIDRKHREDWTGDLLTRFAIASNELPRLGDASSALPGRVVLLHLTRSFYGKEDMGLFDRIVGELPGILLWAIDGWARLRERGRFHQPRSGQALLDELDELSSPVATFIRDKCITGSEEKVQSKELYAAWKGWCTEQGKEHAGDMAQFGKNLRTTMPTLKTRKIGGRGSQLHFYVGLSLAQETGDY